MNADNVVLLAEHEATTDPLRQGLALLCRQLGRPLGIAELGEGMPLQQGRLPLRFVPRALRRADIVARVERLPLVKMDSYLLPALLVICGRWIFWPYIPRFGSADALSRSPWGKLGRAVARRPVVVATSAPVIGPNRLAMRAVP